VQREIKLKKKKKKMLVLILKKKMRNCKRKRIDLFHIPLGIFNFSSIEIDKKGKASDGL
jgi:hypothetical protein